MTDPSDTRDDGTLPADFDPEWYSARYPDVRLLKLTPEDHYLKFGRLLDRAHNARAEAGARADWRSVVALPRSLAQGFGKGPLPDADARPLRRRAESPLIDGPAPGHADPAPGPDLPPPAGALQLLAGEVEIARLSGTLAPDAVLAPIAAYCRMLGQDDPAQMIVPVARGVPVPDTALRLADLSGQRPRCGAAAVTRGALRLADAWFADEATLRLSLTGPDAGTETDGAGMSHTLHVFQSLPDDPARIHRIGAARLTGPGPVVCDAAVFNPMMPVLLAVVGETGLTLGTAVLPFPSLLRGGLHAAERAAYQITRTPMAEVWRLSRALLDALLAQPGDGGRSITALSVDLTGATGAERLASAPVRHWLAAIFGLRVRPAPGTDTGSAAALTWGLTRADVTAAGDTAAPDGLTLQLPADCLPTLSALTTRRLRLPAGQSRAAGPFLVADAVSGRPRWSVSLPMSRSPADQGADLPILVSTVGTETKPEAEDGAERAPHWLAPLHLAVRLTADAPANDAVTLMPRAPDVPHSAGTGAAMSVVLRATDPDRTQSCLDALAGQADMRLAELLICHDDTLAPGAVDTLRKLGRTVCPDGCSLLAQPSGLAFDPRRIADLMSGADLCLIRDDVILYDLRTLAVLHGILAADPAVATVSCALLHEETVNGTARLQLATAGMFPSHVSLISAPRLGVTEPDCLDALPRATYPVLANAFGLCVLRRAAVEGMETPPGGRPGDALADLHFGLALAAAGWRNLCTTRIRAGTARRPQRRDEIDPFGLAAVLPARWDRLLSDITVLQELRG